MIDLARIRAETQRRQWDADWLAEQVGPLLDALDKAIEQRDKAIAKLRFCSNWIDSYAEARMLFDPADVFPEELKAWLRWIEGEIDGGM